MLRASEGWKRGPSAGKWLRGEVLRLRRVKSWRPEGSFGRGELGVWFGRGPPVSEPRSSSSGVRRFRRSSEREFGRRVDLDRSCGSSPAHGFVTNSTR